VPETLVLLHGFGGTHRAWDRVVAELDPQRYTLLALDLPGHGAASSHEGPITFEACVGAVLAASPASFALCGYSMGGRVALHVALAAPERVSRLMLVSTSAGIEDAEERGARRLADRALAYELEQAPFDEFIERWRAQPLFAEDPAEVDALAREDQRRNDPRALVAAMRGLSTGEMQPLWSRLGELTMPVTIVVGERDGRFRALGARLAELAPNAALATIPGGHALALENPAGVASVLNGMPLS
jgi:2-succinyl-6-hydroxy-2,4-cyclohexadiene-1-carboxylate synthase